ncbi:related to acetylesterase [Phialocephala subalpina]|uniref:Related to acetylesterase n=1 Tax=Phialocephala subalpina TaxID=576137 RepID=A0A1L7XKY1_9HELO|nr:related to acetylesterase [Phialocephala subalpina]
MKSVVALSVIALASINSLAIAASIPQTRYASRSWPPKKPAAFFLAGDSTTAAQSNSGGGWGIGFLKTLVNGAIGTDLGYNGATTVSYVAGGAWADVIDSVSRSKASFTPYVTIQFGHNDQKPTANISLAEYSANLKELGLEAIAAGGIPIFVTPLSRRNFNSSGLVIEDLSQQRSATIAVASSIKAAYIDLNEASIKYLDSIGATDAATYNRIPTDFTHLNPVGSVLFGDMVSWLITSTTKYGEVVGEYTSPNRTVVEAIKTGTYIYPSL